MAEDEYKTRGALFVGQGAQQKGMGRELAESSRDAMELWKLAEKASGLPLRGIYWEGGEEEMADTAALQPALTVVNLNIWKAAKPEVDAVAGHSLGEFSALAAAGVLTYADALAITSLRGRLMAQANGGTMAAIVRLPAAEVEELARTACEKSGRLVVCANYNTPLQTVISGESEAVDMVVENATQLKGRGIRLAVSGAFHSPMMEEANRELLPQLKKIDFHEPRLNVYCNSSGAKAASGAEIRENISRQMISPVKWSQLLENMRNAGIRVFMEIGPKSVLGKMVGQCLGKEAEAHLLQPVLGV